MDRRNRPEVAYLLRPKSGGWTAHPKAHSPDQRLLNFNLTAERRGTPVGGHNIQVVLGAPDQKRYGLNEDVAMWLASGWWLTLRNEFAKAPEVAAEILESACEALTAITAEATTARGAEAEALSRKLFSMSFEASGPDYWR